jgi:hypothetical protein
MPTTKPVDELIADALAATDYEIFDPIMVQVAEEPVDAMHRFVMELRKEDRPKAAVDMFVRFMKENPGFGVQHLQGGSLDDLPGDVLTRVVDATFDSDKLTQPTSSS